MSVDPRMTLEAIRGRIGLNDAHRRRKQLPYTDSDVQSLLERLHRVRAILRGLAEAHDEETGTIRVGDTHTCPDCTHGTTPYDHGPCHWHQALQEIERP